MTEMLTHPGFRMGPERELVLFCLQRVFLSEVALLLASARCLPGDQGPDVNPNSASESGMLQKPLGTHYPIIWEPSLTRTSQDSHQYYYAVCLPPIPPSVIEIKSFGQNFL